MLKTILALGAACILAGCATVDYQAYEAKTNRFEGQGGTKTTVAGIDFWANGAPPRPYEILGIVTSEVGSGVGDEGIIRSSVAKEVTKRGGNAAIEVNNNNSFAGVVKIGNYYTATGKKTMRFAVIRYL